MKKLLFTLFLFIGLTTQAQSFDFECVEAIDIPSTDWVVRDGITVIVNGPNQRAYNSTATIPLNIVNLRYTGASGIARFFTFNIRHMWGNDLWDTTGTAAFKTNQYGGRIVEVHYSNNPTADNPDASGTLVAYNTIVNPTHVNLIE